MFRILAVLLIPSLLGAANDWVRFRSGPFEVFSEAGEKPAREVMVELEQTRFVVGKLIGKAELEAVWPFRVVLFRAAGNAAAYAPGEWRLGRDAWMLALVKGHRPPVPQLASILIRANTQRMPDDVERGLATLLSTLEVRRTLIILGAPPPPAERDLAWARLQLLTVNPDYSGRVRVLFSNLQQGADWFSAYKNAFESTPREMDAEVARYLAAGNFPTATISGAPISPRDFERRDFDPEYVETALADLLDGAAAKAAYAAIVAEHPDYPPALEGLGKYAEAVRAGSRSARCYVEFGRRQKQPVRARSAYARAAELNPRWGKPWVLMAGVDTTRAMKITNLRRATQLEPRNTATWVALAKAFVDANDIREAAKAYGGAMRSARSAEEREQYYQARLKLEEKRGVVMSDERRNRIAERQAEQRRMRDEFAEMIERAKETANPNDPNSSDADVVEWWDDPRAKEKVQGTLKQVDCIHGMARLVVEEAGGTTARLLVKDPGKIVLIGGGEQTLGCGPQRPAREVTVEYYVEADTRMKTKGEVTVIEFR